MQRIVYFRRTAEPLEGSAFMLFCSSYSDMLESSFSVDCLVAKSGCVVIDSNGLKRCASKHEAFFRESEVWQGGTECLDKDMQAGLCAHSDEDLSPKR